MSGAAPAWRRAAGARRSSAKAAQPGSGRLATGVFAALVLATVAGLFIAQRLKHAPSAVQGFFVAPSFRPATGSEQFSFRTNKRDVVSVGIVNSTGETVATLVHDLRWQAYLRLCLSWNGRRGSGYVQTRAGSVVTRPRGRCQEAPALTFPAGALAPEGEYRVT